MPGKADRVIGALRQMMGNRGAQRAERAFDEVPGLEKQLTEGALIHSLSDPNAVVAKMNPRRFMDLAVPFTRGYSQAGSLDEHVRLLRDIKTSGQFDGWDEPSFLELGLHDAAEGQPTGVAQVLSHEGRHRSLVDSAEDTPSLVYMPVTKTLGPHADEVYYDYMDGNDAQEKLLQELLLRELIRPEQVGRDFRFFGHIDPTIDDAPGRKRMPLLDILTPFRHGGLAQMRNHA